MILVDRRLEIVPCEPDVGVWIAHICLWKTMQNSSLR